MAGGSAFPDNPIISNGQVIWGSDWTKITIPSGQIHLMSDESIYLGLSNQFQADLMKTVTLNCVGNYPLGVSYALAGDSNVDTVLWYPEPSFEYVSGQYHMTYTGTIGPPQPWWEWIKLTTPAAPVEGPLHVNFTVTQYTSTCTPTPSLPLSFYSASGPPVRWPMPGDDEGYWCDRVPCWRARNGSAFGLTRFHWCHFAARHRIRPAVPLICRPTMPAAALWRRYADFFNRSTAAAAAGESALRWAGRNWGSMAKAASKWGMAD